MRQSSPQSKLSSSEFTGVDNHARPWNSGLEWVARMEKLHGKAEVIIGKQRQRPIGTVALSYQPNLTKFIK